MVCFRLIWLSNAPRFCVYGLDADYWGDAFRESAVLRARGWGEGAAGNFSFLYIAA